MRRSTSSPTDYTVDIFGGWKRARERGRQTALSNVAEFTTEDGLRQPVADRDQALESTLARLEQNDQEAAEPLRDQLAAAREAGYIVDPGLAALAHQAATMLQHLPDSACLAFNPVKTLENAEELTATLKAAATRIDSARQFM